MVFIATLRIEVVEHDNDQTEKQHGQNHPAAGMYRLGNLYGRRPGLGGRHVPTLESLTDRISTVSQLSPEWRMNRSVVSVMPSAPVIPLTSGEHRSLDSTVTE